MMMIKLKFLKLIKIIIIIIMYFMTMEHNGEAKENIFDEDANDEVEATPKTTVNARVVHAVRKFQTSYNNNVNKIAKKASQEKSSKNIDFFYLTTFTMVAEDTKPIEDEPLTFHEVWNHSSLKS